MTTRYIRQLTLPEMTPEKQETLAQTKILMVGAGGLGSAALPYLAGAGIGHIYIADNDRVNISDLHRQIVYRADQAGQSKVTCAGNFLRSLNPEINVHIINEHINEKNAEKLLSGRNIDLILDGSDNFETKALLNKISIEMQIPLITASVTLYKGQIGSFEGYKEDRPCYRCLFPEFPKDAQTYSDIGILGTNTAIIGIMQAHIALCRLLDIDIAHNLKSPFTRIDLKTLEIEHFSLEKDPECPHCCQDKDEKEKKKNKEKSDAIDDNIDEPTDLLPEIETITVHHIEDEKSIIIDVRDPVEVEINPIKHPLISQLPHNIPLPELSACLNEIPKDKRIILLCHKNIRSIHAALYLISKGYYKVCVLDRFSF